MLDLHRWERLPLTKGKFLKKKLWKGKRHRGRSGKVVSRGRKRTETDEGFGTGCVAGKNSKGRGGGFNIDR